MQYKTDHTGRTVYRRHNDFGPLRQLKNVPKIVDFGASLRLDDPDDFGIHPIQPNHYRAPEVILGCGWTFSADIWNLGVLVGSIAMSMSHVQAPGLHFYTKSVELTVNMTGMGYNRRHRTIPPGPRHTRSIR